MTIRINHADYQDKESAWRRFTRWSTRQSGARARGPRRATVAVVLGHLFDFFWQIQQSTFWDLWFLERNLKNKQSTDLSCCGGSVGNVLVLDSPHYYDHNILGY